MELDTGIPNKKSIHARVQTKIPRPNVYIFFNPSRLASKDNIVCVVIIYRAWRSIRMILYIYTRCRTFWEKVLDLKNISYSTASCSSLNTLDRVTYVQFALVHLACNERWHVKLEVTAALFATGKYATRAKLLFVRRKAAQETWNTRKRSFISTCAVGRISFRYSFRFVSQVLTVQILIISRWTNTQKSKCSFA